MKSMIACCVAAATLAVSMTALADDSKPYKDGPVTDISYVRTKPGRFDDYMMFLDTKFKTQMEAYKKAGLITDYAVYSVEPRGPNDPDLMLAITYANMAALDRTADFDAIDRQNLGTMQEQSKAIVDRGPMRDLIGSELIRQQILK